MHSCAQFLPYSLLQRSSSRARTMPMPSCQLLRAGSMVSTLLKEGPAWAAPARRGTRTVRKTSRLANRFIWFFGARAAPLPGVWFGKAFSMPQRMGRPKPYHSPKCLATLQNTWGRKLAGKACAKRPKMPENCVTRLFAMAGSWCYSLTSGRRRGLPCAADSCDWRDVWHAVQPARRKGPSGGRGT